MKYGIKIKHGEYIHRSYLKDVMIGYDRNMANIGFWLITREQNLSWNKPVLTKRLAHSQLFQELYG